MEWAARRAAYPGGEIGIEGRPQMRRRPKVVEAEFLSPLLLCGAVRVSANQIIRWANISVCRAMVGSGGSSSA